MPVVRRLPRHTALAALPAIALDLETTGLDVANNRIIQIGAVAMRGPMVLGEPRIDARVNPGIPIPATSSRIHYITGPDVAGSPFLPEANCLSGSVTRAGTDGPGGRVESIPSPVGSAPRGW